MKINHPSISQFQQLVELKDYRPATKKEYVRYVCKLAEHFQCDPASLTENQVREYFLFLRQHKHYKAAPMKAAKYSLMAFFLDSVKVTGWSVFKEVRIAEPEVLPIVLSRIEVQSLLQSVIEPRFRTVLSLMYHCGLRVGEAVGIQVKDVHGKETPPRLHIARCSTGSRPSPCLNHRPLFRNVPAAKSPCNSSADWPDPRPGSTHEHLSPSSQPPRSKNHPA